ncbi:MAG: molybdate ABC transporter substrate-binding protein [Anaerolineales bacterium]|nr:molybdate ABC transporter substrate-binding protein [Anaerolineales bacterium]
MLVKRLIVFFVLLGLIGCGGEQSESAGPRELTVFAAASLTDAFNDLAEAFAAQHDGVDVVLNYASSSQLAAQLIEGATADVFASANGIQMQNVIANGRITPGAEALFVSNRLTVVVPESNPAGITSLEDLAKPGVQLILAVPGVPVRQYTDEIVAAMPADFQARFYANLVSEEDNVRQVAAKVALGEADAGIVYTSDVTPDIANQVRQINIPDAQNVVATYPIAPLADAPHPALAQQFISFVLSETGQAILARWGFGSPP